MTPETTTLLLPLAFKVWLALAALVSLAIVAAAACEPGEKYTKGRIK